MLSALLHGSIIAVCFPLGALLTVRLRPTHHTIASFMSVGAGLLIAAALVDLTVSGYEDLGAPAASGVLLAAAGLFSGINYLISQRGGKHRKRCGGCVDQPTESDTPGSGRAIALGTVLDAFPEALVLGVVLSSSGGAVSLTAALALGNLAQAISSTSGLLEADRSPRKVLYGWLGLAVLVVLVTVGSFAALSAVGDTVRPWIEMFAAGILVAMISEAMLPEAFDKQASWRGIQTAVGVGLFMLLHELL